MTVTVNGVAPTPTQKQDFRDVFEIPSDTELSAAIVLERSASATLSNKTLENPVYTGTLTGTNGGAVIPNAYYYSSRNAANTLTLPLIGRGTDNRVKLDLDGYGLDIGGGTVNIGGGQIYKDASGNVGLGKSAGLTHKLTVVGNAAQEVFNATQTAVSSQGYLAGTGVYTFGNYYGTGSSWVWRTSPSGGGGEVDRMVLNADGNFGLGVTPSAWGGGTKAIELANGSVISFAGYIGTIGAANTYYNGSNFVYKTTAGAARYDQNNGTHQWFTAPSGTAGNPISFTQAMTLDGGSNLTVAGQVSAGSYLRVDNGDGQSGVDSFRGSVVSNAGSQPSHGASIDFRGSWADNGYIVFATSFGGTNRLERARIDYSGNLLVGTTSTNFDVKGLKYRNDLGTLLNTAVDNTVFFAHRMGSTGVAVDFYCMNAGVGSISVTGTATAYNTSSDARLKENIAAADNGSALIDQLQVRQFDWKADGSHQRYGFVAQELDAVFPEAVSKPADPEQMMGVDYSKLVPLLVQEVQSLRARLAILEAKQ